MSLTIEDSILAEPRQDQDRIGSIGSASMGSVGGGAMVAVIWIHGGASLMHHAPVLRHRHVAVRHRMMLCCDRTSWSDFVDFTCCRLMLEFGYLTTFSFFFDETERAFMNRCT
jgi:hypothetical protein